MGGRPRPLVGGHDEDGAVEGADPRQHVAEETFVARDVDDADLPAGRELEPGEAQVDGETPALLLLEAVRVDAGQGLDECALAVVDVTGGGGHGNSLPARARERPRPGAAAHIPSRSGATGRRA